MALNPLSGNLGFGNSFLLADDAVSFLIDPTGHQFLLAAQNELPSVAATDTIFYIFQFTDVAQAESDSVVGPFMAAGGSAQEVLVFADTTVNSVTPQSGFWVMVSSTGGVQSSLYFSSNIQLCIDINLLSTGEGLLGSNLDTAHICIIVSNYGSFITNGIAF